jgi:hypothetical protein
MKELHPLEFDIKTSHFGVHKIIGSSYYRVTFRVIHTQIHGASTTYYCIPLHILSNGFLSDPNKDHMKNVCPQEIDIPTYHIEVNKTIQISYSIVMIMVYYILTLYIGPFTSILLGASFPTVS